MNLRYLLLLLLPLILLAYVSSWVNSGSASLSFGGYDLAEWTSLHPVSRADNLLTPLLLRLPLVCTALIAAWIAPRFQSLWTRGLLVVLALMLAAALLPPLEYFTIARSDPNYQQQFGLAMIAFTGTVAGLIIRPLRTIAALPAFIGAGVSVIGLMQSLKLFEQFGLMVSTGVGGIATALLFIVCAGVLIAGQIQQTSRSDNDLLALLTQNSEG